MHVKHLDSENRSLQQQYERAAQCEARLAVQGEQIAQMQQRDADLIQGLWRIVSQVTQAPVDDGSVQAVLKSALMDPGWAVSSTNPTPGRPRAAAPWRTLSRNSWGVPTGCAGRWHLHQHLLPPHSQHLRNNRRTVA